MQTHAARFDSGDTRFHFGGDSLFPNSVTGTEDEIVEQRGLIRGWKLQEGVAKRGSSHGEDDMR